MSRRPPDRSSSRRQWLLVAFLLPALAVALVLAFSGGWDFLGTPEPSPAPGSDTKASKPRSVSNYGRMDKAYIREHRDRGFGATSDTYPGRDRIENGILTEKGMRASFREITGIDLPDWVVPIGGSYVVKKYLFQSAGNFNAHVEGFFRTEPARIPELVGKVKVGLERKLAGTGVELQQVTYDMEYPRIVRKGFEFLKGSMGLSAREKKEGKHIGYKHDYSFMADPTTGLIMIMGFRGDEE